MSLARGGVCAHSSGEPLEGPEEERGMVKVSVAAWRRIA